MAGPVTLTTANTSNIPHIFNGTGAIQKIYIGKVGSPTFSVTFQNLTANKYFRYDPAQSSGSITPSYFGTQIHTMFYYYSNFDQTSSQSTYQIDFASSYTKTPTHLEINTRSYPLTRLTGITITKAYGTQAVTRAEDIPTASNLQKSYRIKLSDGTYIAPDASSLVWQNTNPPSITSFTVFPSTVDLDLEDNNQTASVTFRKERTGVYWFISSQYGNRQTDFGSSTGFNSLVSIGHYYIGTSGRLSGPPSDSHYYQFAVRNTDANYQNYNTITINGRNYNLGKSSTDFNEHGIVGREYWTTSRIPNSADWVTDSRLTLSIKFNVDRVIDKLRFNFAVSPTANQITSAQIYNVTNNNAEVGTRFQSTSGAGITQTLSNIDRPNQSTVFRLVSSNTGGSTHRDATLTITQNPRISNLRRTGFRQVDTGGNFQFSARVSGYPQPLIDWVFGNGADSQRNNDNVRFTPVPSQVNTWNIVVGGSSGMYHPVLNDSFTLTAGNGSGSVRQRINNISA